MNIVIVLALFGYVIYILMIRHSIIRAKYANDKTGIALNENFDNIKLLELLREKGFTYPEFINLRHNELGQVVIAGKYTSHALIIKNDTLYVDRGIKGLRGRQTKCIIEAVVIGHYLSKFFNPNAPVDAYKEYRYFKRGRLQPFILALLFCIVLVFYIFDEGKELIPTLKPNIVSSSYLSEYSTDVTIGNAFEHFFGNPKWKSYDQGIQKYVDFQGGVQYNNEPATAVITFSLSGDKFMVESVKIDNEPLNPLELKTFFQTVYAGSE